MTNAQMEPQTRLEEIVIEEEGDLSVFLAEFMETKSASSEATAAHKVNKNRLEAWVDTVGWEAGQTVRCGVYTITITQQEAREVSFERVTSRRVSVKVKE